MKKLILLIISIIFAACSNIDNNVPEKIKIDGIKTSGVIQNFGTDKVIYITENNEAIIISNSGQVLSKTNLNISKPIEKTKFLKTSIPAHDNDTLYARIQFIDDMIYFNYHVKNGKTYSMKPYLQSTSLIKLLDLPCQSGWIGDVDDKKFYSCQGKVHASLAIWEEIDNYSLSTTIRVNK